MVDWVWYHKTRMMMARTMIRGHPGNLEMIAERTKLTLEEVEKEEGRIHAAWIMLLDRRPDEDILRMGIEFPELCDLKAIRRDRRKLFLTAYSNGMTVDNVVNYFEIVPSETEMWHEIWKEEKEEGII